MARPRKSPAADPKKKEEVTKWFKTGPIDEIDKEAWFKMDSKHRELYNLYRNQQTLQTELNLVTSQIETLSKHIMEQIKDYPSHPYNSWAWVEKMHQTKPKWKQIALAINEKKALKLAKEYTSKVFPFLRIRFIHPNKD
jgi:hypothetical protein